MPTLIIVLVLVTLVIIFSVQNAASVAFTFLFWKTQASLAIIIFLSVTTGVVIGAILTSIWMLRRSARKKSKQSEAEAPPTGL